mmetsp:Transcript_9785/g.14544  ORF Transcript_9785/g.14544 Transcript_9785/m.14544 type:complete len:1447 (+) Transcript_9785:2423-6763(+)|eukprot:CAMPEP_0196820594 /NCGR_PEP_ID=MMETSP1362-20130617/75952_1 /TAXON_ID=163516 /ORGANISM="Leptocylindrus danicus, Strain CCMP1856" /LENGTH=1446 /DNA_ID=CAMNT_0042199535 /DNA_START=2366 /DNA_END=6706 /DNA_ORIENTATION=+
MTWIKGKFFKRRRAVRKSDSELERLIDGMDKSDDGSSGESHDESSALVVHESSSMKGDGTDKLVNMAYYRGNEHNEGISETVFDVGPRNPFCGIANAVRDVSVSVVGNESQYRRIDMSETDTLREEEDLNVKITKKKLGTLSDLAPPCVEVQRLPSDASSTDEILLDLRTQESMIFERKCKGKRFKRSETIQKNDSSSVDDSNIGDNLDESKELVGKLLDVCDKDYINNTVTTESEPTLIENHVNKEPDTDEIIPGLVDDCHRDESTPSANLDTFVAAVTNEDSSNEKIAIPVDDVGCYEDVSTLSKLDAPAAITNEIVANDEVAAVPVIDVDYRDDESPGSKLDEPSAVRGKRKSIRLVLLRSIRKLSSRSILQRDKKKMRIVNTGKAEPETKPAVLPNCATEDASVVTAVIQNGGRKQTGNDVAVVTEPSAPIMVSLSALLEQPDSFPPPPSNEDHLAIDELPPFQASMDSLELYLDQLTPVSSDYSKLRGLLSNSDDMSDEDEQSDEDDLEEVQQYVSTQNPLDQNLSTDVLAGTANGLTEKVFDEEHRMIGREQNLEQGGREEKLAKQIDGWMKPDVDESDEDRTEGAIVIESNPVTVPPPSAYPTNSSSNLFSLYSLFGPFNEAVDGMGRRMNLVASGLMRGGNNNDAVALEESQETTSSTAIAQTQTSSDNLSVSDQHTDDSLNQTAPVQILKNAPATPDVFLESRDPTEDKGPERETLVDNNEIAEKSQSQLEGYTQTVNASINSFYHDEASCAQMTLSSWVTTSSLLASVGPMLLASPLTANIGTEPKDESTEKNDEDAKVYLSSEGDTKKTPEGLSSGSVPIADSSSEPPKKKKRGMFKKFFTGRKKKVSDGDIPASKSKASPIVREESGDADKKLFGSKRPKSAEKASPLLKKKVVAANSTKSTTISDKTKIEKDSRTRRIQIIAPKPAKKGKKKDVVEKKSKVGNIFGAERKPIATRVGKKTNNSEKVRPIHLKVFNRNKNRGKDDRLQVAQSDRVNAWIDYTRYGKPLSVFRFHKVLGRPKIDHPDEVLIIVEASTISGNDCLMRQNKFHTTVSLPNIPGCDCVGRVYRCGNGAKKKYNIQKNDRVCCLSPNLGGNARYVKVHAKELMSVPNNANAVEVACLMQTYATAYQCLHRSGHQPIKWGDKILIIGGNTPLGLATIQLALLANASLVCASADPFYHPLLKSLGVVCLGSDTEECVYKLRDRMDIVVDCLCTSDAELVHVAANITGKVILTKKPRFTLDFNPCNFDLNNALPNICIDRFPGFPCCGQRLPARTFYFDLLGSKSSNPSAYASDLLFLMRLLSAGKIAPKVSKCVPLESVPLVHEQLEHRKFEGDVICLPWMVVTNDKKVKTKQTGYNLPMTEKGDDDDLGMIPIIDRGPTVELESFLGFGDRTADFIVSCLYDRCQVDLNMSSSSDDDYSYFSDDDTTELY